MFLDVFRKNCLDGGELIMFYRFLTRVVLALLFSFSLNLTAIKYVFSHGFSDTGRQSFSYVNFYKKSNNLYRNSRYILYQPLIIFNYPDVIFRKFVNIFKTSLGQINEVKTLMRNYNRANNDEVVLFGVSRGASTAINFASKYKPKNLKALVLESPFDKVEVVLKTHWFTSFLAKIPGVSNKVVYNLFKKMSKYDENGLHPIDMVGHIDKNVPVIFICTKTDSTVSCSSTVNLYKKLIETGHKKAHLLVLDSGRHARLMKSSEGQKMQNVVHAFYKKYGLPHNPEFADQGAALFAKC